MQRKKFVPLALAGLGAVASVVLMRAYEHSLPAEQAGPVREVFGALVAGAGGFFFGRIFTN